MQKIKVFHFNNGGGGGTFSVVKNLLKYSTNAGIENHVIYTINKAITPQFEMPCLQGAASQQLFYYSPKWNFYYTCRQLAKLLPDDKAVIVAHDWLELGMGSNLGLQNPVVYFLHGDFDYYYELAKKHDVMVDQFITISPIIYKKLSAQLPNRIKDIHYCRFPVPLIPVLKKDNKILKIFYCVRRLDDERKQFKILPLINAALKLKGITVHWTITGEGLQKKDVENLMEQQSGISLFPSLANEEVINLLPGHDLFILPSLKEGFPVTVVEAMKAGLLPLVTNWDGATEELVIEGETGYYFATGNVSAYAERIALLDADRNLLKCLAEEGMKKANELFEPFINTKNIEEVISKVYYTNRKYKKPVKVYGSRLDKLWMPNMLAKTIRSIRK